jgi:hypothetical protein
MKSLKLRILTAAKTASRAEALIFLPLALVSPAIAQGTMTFTFEGAPPGTELNVGVYYSSGMYFGPIGPGNVLLSGPGRPGYATNGTGYLEIPDGNLAVLFTNTPTRYFNLLSFDAAEFDGFGPQTLTVVGYPGMSAPVTNYFTVSSLTFQTFYLDSSFTTISRFDVLNARWSLDNLVISGVPEPSAAALASVAAACALVRRHRQRKSHAP